MFKKKCLTFGVLVLAVAFTSTKFAQSTPTPKLKPSSLLEKSQTEKPVNELDFPAAGFNSGWPKDVVISERAECAVRLKGLGVTFKALPPLGVAKSCGAAAPLEVSEIAGVSIVPAGTFTCDMVEALHGWIGNSIVPAARQHLKKKLVTINNATAYACRRRNGLASGKLSEHAKANALDIATLGFDDGSFINIKGDWSGVKQLIGVSAKGNFLRQIRRDSCIRFTTVLGPGSDKYHGDHFHIDVARRKNGYRICN
jgi:hypothetical protein